MVKKLSESYQPGRLQKVKEQNIYKITPEMQKELKEIAKMADEEINLDDPDAQEIKDWSNSVSAKFYRPIKKSINIRVDSDILEWFKSQGKGRL